MDSWISEVAAFRRSLAAHCNWLIYFDLLTQVTSLQVGVVCGLLGVGCGLLRVGCGLSLCPHLLLPYISCVSLKFCTADEDLWIKTSCIEWFPCCDLLQHLPAQPLALGLLWSHTLRDITWHSSSWLCPVSAPTMAYCWHCKVHLLLCIRVIEGFTLLLSAPVSACSSWPLLLCMVLRNCCGILCHHL